MIETDLAIRDALDWLPPLAGSVLRPFDFNARLRCVWDVAKTNDPFMVQPAQVLPGPVAAGRDLSRMRVDTRLGLLLACQPAHRYHRLARRMEHA